MWNVRPAKPQISLRTYLSDKGSSESTLIKMPHCWQLHVTAQIIIVSKML